MKLKEFDILLDIKRNKKVEEFEIVQGDYETNILRISLVEDFNEYELSGLDIEIAFAKSDGTTVLQDTSNGIELIGNKIVCTLKTNTIASPGKVLAEVRVLQDLKLLTSSRFSFFVRQSIVNDKTIESTNEFPILNQLITDVTGLLDEIQSKPEIQGYSAYQVWLNQGNIGTVDDYLSSLVGETGPPGPQGEPGVQGERGPTGSIDNLDKGNITEALGYTPADNNLIGLLASLTTEQKTNLVAAINEVNTDLVAHKAEMSSKHITESGSNANGSYIKFDDGTMICMITFVKEFATTVARGSLFGLTEWEVWTYPATFTSTPSISGLFNGGDATRGMFMSLVSSNLTTGISYTVLSTQNFTGTFRTHLMAIGRWK